MTELAIVTGAVELIVVDYQCIMPSLVTIGNCYHTKMVTTADKAKFTGAEHVKFEMHNGMAQARKVVRMAIERFSLRNKDRVEIPQGPIEMMTGFANETLLAGSSPEWYSEKAAAIGTYCVASGIYTHLGHPPNITGSEVVTNLALEGLDNLVGACFGIEPDPFKAAELIDKRIRQKRKALGLGE